jgi:AraC family transcriptional regulator
MEVGIKAMPALRAAALAHVGPYWTISRAFAQLGRFIVPAGLLDRPHTMVAIYHDDPKLTPPRELRSSAGVLLADDELTPAGLSELVLPSGRFACYTHAGAYEGLGAAWAELLDDWMPQSGERVAGRDPNSTYELYLNHPGKTPRELLRTELYVMLLERTT